MVAPTDSTSAKSSRTVPIGPIIGAVLAVVVLTGVALFICYLRVIKRRRVARLAQPGTTSTGNLLTNTEFIAAMQQRSSITKGDQTNPAAAPSSTPQRGMDLESGQR
ncbi:MAG TPA: hypothetical protein VGO47_11215, partial [Chlamydiales bacterium]|nr:hypothetical protein [Chlamydiales bacterium]